MTGQNQTDYIGKFFDNEKNTSLGFDSLSKVYDTSGRNVIEGVCMRLLGEYNNDKAVYSYPCETEQFKPEHGYGNVKGAHEKMNLTWYDINDDGITRKNPGMNSDFVDII